MPVKTERLRCEEVREELSARLDNEASPHLRALVDDHLERCSACSSHRDALASVRRRLRIQSAEATPDLAAEILRRVPTAPRFNLRPYLRTALVAAAATALVVAGLSFPDRADERDVASAFEIVAEVRAASRRLTEYQAKFDVREKDWHASIGDRRFQVAIWYRAPEMLRVEIQDRTAYPDDRWPRADATLVSNRTRTFVRETSGCPPSALPGCTTGSTPETHLVQGKQPLRTSRTSITDVVLPLETLASADAMEVVGAGDEILGRRTIHVRLPYWQAHLMVEAVQPASSPTIDPGASVDLMLDAENWFPLRFVVTEPDGGEVLTASARKISPRVDRDVFDVPKDARTVVHDGFRMGATSAVAPTFQAGLEAYRNGRTTAGNGVATFADGLAWLTVTTSQRRPPAALVSAETVRLPKVGPALYEPASLYHARVLEIFDGERRIRLESNLPRETLLRVADSVPVDGRVIEKIRSGRNVIERATSATVQDLPFVAVPSNVPYGYTSVSATITRHDGHITDAVLRYRDPQNEYTGGGVVITASRDQPYLPPSAERFVTYEIAGNLMRWAPQRGELEWMDGRTYRSVRVTDFDVDVALSIARTMT